MINEVMKNNEKVVEFVIHKEAKEFLSKLDKKKVNNYKSIQMNKIAILTIAGPQRTGKSFLANRFCNKL
jgi:polynucleotide 5'-kinase involved in rRNA processing